MKQNYFPCMLEQGYSKDYI